MFYQLIMQHTDRERVLLIQLRKHIVWLSSGHKGSSAFRQRIFKAEDHIELMQMVEEYFMTLMASGDRILDENSLIPAISSGHG